MAANCRKEEIGARRTVEDGTGDSLGFFRLDDFVFSLAVAGFYLSGIGARMSRAGARSA